MFKLLARRVGVPFAEIWFVKLFEQKKKLCLSSFRQRGVLATSNIEFLTSMVHKLIRDFI